MSGSDFEVDKIPLSIEAHLNGKRGSRNLEVANQVDKIPWSTDALLNGPEGEGNLEVANSTKADKIPQSTCVFYNGSEDQGNVEVAHGKDLMSKQKKKRKACSTDRGITGDFEPEPSFPFPHTTSLEHWSEENDKMSEPLTLDRCPLGPPDSSSSKVENMTKWIEEIPLGPNKDKALLNACLLYTSPSPRDV
jgi:hypothetical protein